ncbi:MAG: hypothetical protein M3044_05690 [Thermoproteota archaeon]|nr:hypothetical protein [Thermoproteota archaeon]
MSSNNEDDTSSAPGGETSADYLISESGKQTETTKAKKSGFDSVTDKIKEKVTGPDSVTDKIKEKVTGPDSVTDKIKEKVTGAGESIREGAASTVGRDDDDHKTKDLESAQASPGEIGDAASDPTTTGPTENLREKAAKTIDESEDSEEPT